jgi:hypothetical protein
MTSTPFRAGGALTDIDFASYVERQADREVLDLIATMNYVLVVEPRQQGKSSLVNRLIRHPDLQGTSLVYVDVTTVNRESDSSWYGTLCPRILRQLRSFIPAAQWQAFPQNSTGWRDFLWQIAASATDAGQRVVIALDEVGAVPVPSATDFFSVLRDVFNSRQAETEFRQIAFVLVGAFHPRDLIKDDRVSPFNIAHRVRLMDFSLAQVAELVGRGKWTKNPEALLAERIHHWTDGQPYLTQWLCANLSEDATVAEVDAAVEHLLAEDENHLPPLLERLREDEKSRDYLARVRSGEKIKFFPLGNRRLAQLELLGVLKADSEGYCVIRNEFYKLALWSHSVLSQQIVPESKWNTKTIRDLLTAAFSDEELITLCFDYFPAVHEKLGSGVSKGDKIQHLLDYCVRQGQVEYLLTVVREGNPVQYQRFEDRIKG